MIIEKTLDIRQVKERLYEYIAAEVWNNIDDGTTLADCVESGADIPELTAENVCQRIRDCVEMTFDQFFIPGWPYGGIPKEILKEILDWIDNAMKMYVISMQNH
jgi:hypothetical protein